ncbi:YqzM family protein [Bacillus licheniformis]|nr:YqzM family protein [Bacillus licheniformis]
MQSKRNDLVDSGVGLSCLWLFATMFIIATVIHLAA